MPPRLRGIALPFTDAQRSAAFWEACFGFPVVRRRGTGHVEVDAGGTPLYLDDARSADAGAHPAPVVEVTDLDETLARCAAAGHAPMGALRELSDGGRYAALHDPDGHRIWLYQSGVGGRAGDRGTDLAGGAG